MRLVDDHTGLSLEISAELVKRLAIHARGQYPNEFGGLLLGRYIEDGKTVIIEETILPKKYTSSRYYFERGSEGLKDILEQKFQETPSLVYVGEWHSHPDNPAIPSRIDLMAMKEIAEHKDVLITNPVLLILELRKKTQELGAFLYYDGGLYQYKELFIITKS